MGLFGKLIHRHEKEFNIDDIPMGDYDPNASQQKVDRFLADINNPGNANQGQAQQMPGVSQQSAFENQPQDVGLPPDPNQGHFGEQANTNQNYGMSQSQANTMPNGMTGQELANKYTKQQEYLDKQANLNPQQPVGTHQKQTHQEEIINLKLDSMKSQLDAINQRMLRIEQLLNNGNNKKW